MCVIIHKKAGISLASLSLNLLEKAFATNPDGAGFAIRKNGEKTVSIEKGFFAPEDLLAALGNYDIKTEDEVTVHCRIATAGSISAGNCHPFPITQDIGKLKAERLEKVPACLIHNGVIGKGNPVMDLSDTMELALTLSVESVYSKNTFDKARKAFIEPYEKSNRFVFYFPQETVICGNWHTSESGLMYSNTYFLEEPRHFSNSKWYYGKEYGFNNYRDFDYDTYSTGEECPYCGSKETMYIDSQYRILECENCTTLFGINGKVYETPNDTYWK